MKKQETARKRHWAGVIYPDSLPEDWEDILIQTGLSIAISPLHDKDVNPTGEIKKAHYHIILSFDGPTSFNVVNKIMSELNAPIPQSIESIKGMFRYHLHLDNPEKAQYEDDDRKFINGFNPLDLIELTKGEVTKIKIELLDFIAKGRFIEYCTFVDNVRSHLDIAHVEVALNNTIFFNTYLSSARNKAINSSKVPTCNKKD